MLRTHRVSAITIAVAAVALVFSLGGSALAARHYLLTSRSQIAPALLKQLQRPGARGPVGAAGAPGVPGAPGATGASGANGAPGDRGPSAGRSFSQTTDLSSTGVYNGVSGTVYPPVVYTTGATVPAGAQSDTARFVLSTTGTSKPVLCQLNDTDSISVTVVPGTPLNLTLLGTVTTTQAGPLVIVCQVPGLLLPGNTNGEKITISSARSVAVLLGSETHS